MMDFGKCFLYTVPPPTFLHVMVSVTPSQPQSENNEWKMLEANILCSLKMLTIVRNVTVSTSSCLGCKSTLCPAYTLCICNLSLHLSAAVRASDGPPWYCSASVGVAFVLLTNAPNAKSHVAKERPGHRTQRNGLPPVPCDCCRKPQGMNRAWYSLRVSESTPTPQMRVTARVM